MKSRQSALRLSCILTLLFSAITSAWASPGLVITPTTLPMCFTNVPYNQTLTAAGGTAPYTFAVTGGSLPGRLALSTNGVLSGNPAPTNPVPGDPFTVTATDSIGATGSVVCYVPIYNERYDITTIAGLSGSAGGTDGTNGGARFSFPYGIALDGVGNVYMADRQNSSIRELALSGTNWVVTTVAGLSGSGGSGDGTNTGARFSSPNFLTVDGAGNLYVADTGNNDIREITPAGTNWVVTTIAGTAGTNGSADGMNGAAQFRSPRGIAVDGAGNLYVADSDNDTIRKITPIGTNWVVTTIAGTAGVTNGVDGTNGSAHFTQPYGLTVDAAGNLFVADTFNDTIREITPSGTNWVVTTVAGTAGLFAVKPVDGTNSNARFWEPTGIAVDGQDNVYVADEGTFSLRQIQPLGTSWLVKTVAGGDLTGSSVDGVGIAAVFSGESSPGGVASDSFGNVYLTDTGNDTIRKGVPEFVATLIVQSVTNTYDGNPHPVPVATLPSGLPFTVNYGNGSTNAPVNAGKTIGVMVSVSSTTNYFASAFVNQFINPGTVSITFSNLVQAYDGTAKAVSVSGIPTNVPLLVAYAYPMPSSLNFNPPTNVGTYQVLSGPNSNNYSGISSNIFTITQGTAFIVLTNLTQAYDGTPKSVTVTTVPPGLTTAVTYNGSSIVPSNAGSYTVVVSVVDSNYVGSVTNTLDIGGAPILVNCSSNISVTAPDANGAVVTFDVSGSGGCSPPDVEAVPPSGSTFPIGTTTVNVMATDSCGGSNSCVFTVTVTPPPTRMGLRLDGSLGLDIADHDPNPIDHIQNGQTAPTAMPAAFLGSPVSRNFIIENTGAADLIVSGASVPAGYTVTSPSFPATVPASNYLALTIQQDAATNGYYAGSVVITNSSTNAPVFSFPIYGVTVDSGNKAEFAEHGSTLFLMVGAGVSVNSITHTATTATFSITAGGTTWAGTDSANVTANGSTDLVVTPAGSGVFTNVEVIATSSGAQPQFRLTDSTTNDVWPFSLKLDTGNAGANNVGGWLFVRGEENFGPHSLVLRSCFYINPSGQILTTSGNITMEADWENANKTFLNAHVVLNQASLSTVSGQILLRGYNINGLNNEGVADLGPITSTGTGAGLGHIIIRGHEEHNFPDEAVIVFAPITSVDADIDISGSVSANDGSGSQGIVLANTVTSMGHGNITMLGLGGTGDDIPGIDVPGGAISNAFGNITLTGQNRGGTTAPGIRLGSIFSVHGTVNLLPLTETGDPGTVEFTTAGATTLYFDTNNITTPKISVTGSVVIDPNASLHTIFGGPVGSEAAGNVLRMISDNGPGYTGNFLEFPEGGPSILGQTPGTDTYLAGAGADLDFTIGDSETTPPEESVDIAATQDNPTTNLTINFTAVFTEPVNGFVADGLILGGTAAGPRAAVITELFPFDQTVYNIAVSGHTNVGTVTVALQDSVVTDVWGNLNLASTEGSCLYIPRGDAAPAITNVNKATFTAGADNSFTFTASGAPPVRILTGDFLPGGLVFTINDDGSAVLTGTPAAGTGGSYNLDLIFSNGVPPEAEEEFTLTINAAPVITSSNSTSFIRGQAGSFTVTSAGFPVSALSVGGALPPSGNIAFQAHGDGTASLAGTPTPADVGTYPLTITAANGTAPDATQNFTLVINPPPPIDLVCSTNMTAIATDASGAQVFFNLSASGGCDGPFVNALPFSSGGEFPPGTTIEDVTATDDCGDTTNCSFTVTVYAAPLITSSNSTSFIGGQAGSFTVTSTGFPVSALSVGGALPPSGNIAFQAHGDGTASLAGTPTPADVGTYPLTITAANGTAPDATQNFTLVINPPPPIDLVCSTNMTAIATDASGTQVFFNLSASGGCDGPFVNALPFSSGGEFPPGTTIEDVTATDDCGDTTNCSFTVTVYETPSITSANQTTFAPVSVAHSFTVTSAGFPTCALTLAGSLPPSGNITFHDNGNGTATLAGTPAPTDAGSYPLTLTASNGIAANATQNFTLLVGCQNITVVPSFVPFCALSVPYLQANNGAGGSAPYTITLTGGALPPGLTLTNNGVLSGTPTNAGVYNFTLTGVDSNGCPGSTNLSVAVVPAVTVIFSSGSGTWTVPNVVSNAEIRMWGGGGGGGVNNRNGNFGGGGGGGGGYTAGYVAVVPGSHIAYAVGASGTVGVQGGTSTFTGLTAAGGGKAGGPTATGMGPGVPGGVGIGGTAAGGIGGIGSPNGGNGGTGGGPGGGTGGTGGTTGGGGAGSSPGGGGGGGGKSSVAMLPGGAGGAGEVMVIYVLPTPVFFNLTASQVAFYGQTIALSGTLSAAVPTGTLYPSNGETISVTIGSVVTNTTINDATGDFSLSCNLTGIPASAIPYPIKYAYGGDASLNVGADASTALMLNPAPASVILTNLAQAYDGTPKSVTVTTVPPGLATVVTYNGSSNAPTNVGSYTVVGSVVNSNYVGNMTNTLTIGSSISPATVLVSNLVQVYDGTGKSVTVTTVPPGLATAVTYNGSLAAPTNAGSYTVITTVTDPSYTGGATNTLVVNQAPVFTSTNSATFNFALSNTFAVTAAGFPVPALTAVSNLPTGLLFTDNGNGSATLSGVPVPSYGKFFPLSFVASNSVAGGVVTQSFQLTLDFVPYHPAVTNTVAISTTRNVPVTLGVPFLIEMVNHTNDIYSRITAVDPTSFQGYGRIVWSNNAIIYVPALDYTGADFFEYTATNASHSTAGRVNVTVADGTAGEPLGVSVTPDTNGYLVVFASSNAGGIFNVEYRSTLEPTELWLPLTNGLHTDHQPGVQTRGLILFEDRTSPSPTRRFYRVLDALPE